jgi:hypothetical protein
LKKMNKIKVIKDGPKLTANFFRQGEGGAEPVRVWLKSLPEAEMAEVGKDIMAVQFGWPLGLPLVDHVEGDIWESAPSWSIGLHAFCLL